MVRCSLKEKFENKIPPNCPNYINDLHIEPISHLHEQDKLEDNI